MNVVVIGASDKKDRYSYKAVTRLAKARHRVFPVHPTLGEIDGLKVYNSLPEIKDKIDTVSIYVRSDKSSQMAEDIFRLRPKRIIFNPGAENPELMKMAVSRGIETLEACTLVMLSTNQF